VQRRQSVKGVEAKIHIFRMSAMDIGEWTSSRSYRFISVERSSGNCFIGQNCRNVYREVLDPVGGTGGRTLSEIILISFSCLVFTRKHVR
jgi:hypothetical protein